MEVEALGAGSVVDDGEYITSVLIAKLNILPLL